MTQNKLEVLLREWQQIMRLQDWNTQVRFADYAQIEAVGLNMYNPRLKESRISIAHPSTVPSTSMGNLDIEATLVHELMHLHAAPLCEVVGDAAIKSNPTAMTALENLVELTAQALVLAKRGTKRNSLYAESKFVAKPKKTKTKSG